MRGALEDASGRGNVVGGEREGNVRELACTHFWKQKYIIPKRVVNGPLIDTIHKSLRCLCDEIDTIKPNGEQKCRMYFENPLEKV